MRLSNFAYLVGQGARNIVNNKLMSFACIGVLVACLLLIGGAAMLSLNVNSMVGYVEDQNEVFVFLSDGMSETDIGILDLKLKEITNIMERTFISKEEALEQQILALGEDSGLIEDLRGANNPLPDEYIIRVRDLARLDDTVARIKELEGVDKVNAPTEVAKLLVGVRQIITVAGASIVLILVVVSVAIITNTIKLTVFSRRREINIMKYVGATDAFIRLPFLAEGMLIGLFSAAIAFLILGFGYTYLLQYLEANFAQYIGAIFTKAVDFWSLAPYIFGSFAALGVFIGTTGSGIFVRRYLKV